uniref:Putative 5'-nucleotidase/apyrase n=1 Tax=Ixodes ricinus TaxID=34613 RepID=A0A0K8RCG9_IXORI
MASIGRPAVELGGLGLVVHNDASLFRLLYWGTILRTYSMTTSLSTTPSVPFTSLIECESVSTICNVACGDNTICFVQHYRLVLRYLTFGTQNIKFDYSAFFWKREIKSHSYS